MQDRQDQCSSETAAQKTAADQLSESQDAASLPDSWLVSSSASLPECCHSGCTVCVLDYPELFAGSDELRMLEAMEKALAQIDRS